MSRKIRRKAQEAQEAQKRRRRFHWWAVAACSALALVVLVAWAYRYWTKVEDIPLKFLPADLQQAVAAAKAWQPTPEEEEAIAVISKAFFPEKGYELFEREADIPWREMLVPEKVWSDQEFEVLGSAIAVIGTIEGPDAPVFKELKRAYQQDGDERTIMFILPMDRNVALGTRDNPYFIDAAWAPSTRCIYMNRRIIKYYTFFISTLYQEAYHALQLKGAALRPETVVQIELEAHAAQIAFNNKLIELMRKGGEKRFELELRAVNANLLDSMKKYAAGEVKRQAVSMR